MAFDSTWNDVTRNWKPPSEVASSGPREVRLTGTGKLMMGAMVFLLAVSVAWNMWSSRKMAREAADRSALAATHAETQATVTRHWDTEDKEHTLMLAYRFEYDGRIYHASTSAPQKQWDGLDVGSTIAVRFLPDRPEINHPSAWPGHVTPAFVPWAFPAIFVPLAIVLLVTVRRDQALLRDGRAAPARVTWHRRGKGGSTFLYEFPLPGGGVQKGRYGPRRTPPELGSIITVMYDSENPKRNAAYPLEFSRVER
jgi:hypothetical protein